MRNIRYFREIKDASLNEDLDLVNGKNKYNLINVNEEDLVVTEEKKVTSNEKIFDNKKDLCS